MDRYIGLDVHASSCTLAVVGPSGKRLGSQVVETNARALIEVLRGIPKQRHMCMEEGTLSEWLHEMLEPHVDELVVTGVGKKSRGPKSEGTDAKRWSGCVRAGRATEDRLDRDAGLQGARPIRATGKSGEGLWIPGGRHGTGEEPAEERTALERRRLRSGPVRVLEARPGAMARRVAGGDEGACTAPLRRARRARGSAREGREDDAGRGQEASGVACAADMPGLGPDSGRRATAGCGDAVSVQKPERVLGLLRPGHRDAQLVGLGASSDGRLGEGARAADSRSEPKLQPHAETDFQGSRDDGDRAGGGRITVPALREPAGRRHETEPGEADDRASDRVDHTGAMAHGREVRPGETASYEVNRPRNDERGVESCVQPDGSDEPKANRLQGKASIEMLGWAEWPESPRIGYAPLESQTKRWANEPQIGGWFLLPSGERQGCEGPSDCDAEPASAPTLNRRTGNPNNADACGQKMGRWRVVDVCLDHWPHRRISKALVRVRHPV